MASKDGIKSLKPNQNKTNIFVFNHHIFPLI